MSSNRRLLYNIVFLVLLSVSCTKTIVTEKKIEFEKVTISATISDTWGNANLTMQGIITRENNNANNYTIHGQTSNYPPVSTIDIYANIIDTGTYSLGSPNSLNYAKYAFITPYIPVDSTSVSYFNSFYSTGSSIPGSLRITKLDTINKIISGSFNFTAIGYINSTAQPYYPYLDTAIVTNGSF